MGQHCSHHWHLPIYSTAPEQTAGQVSCQRTAGFYYSQDDPHNKWASELLAQYMQIVISKLLFVEWERVQCSYGHSLLTVYTTDCQYTLYKYTKAQYLTLFSHGFIFIPATSISMKDIYNLKLREFISYLTAIQSSSFSHLVKIITQRVNLNYKINSPYYNSF